MPRFTGPAQAAVGALLLIVLMLPPLRHALEAGMRQHMLLQFPALMLAGALLARGLPPAMGRRLASCNAMGIAGLTAGALSMAVLMIPRALDLALVDARVEAVKVAALLLAGAVLESSWRAAGLVVQAFFVGSVVPMAIVVGTLFQDSPLRLCNAYRLDDQQRLGTELVWIATVVGVSWLLQAIWRSISSESVGGSALANPTQQPWHQVEVPSSVNLAEAETHCAHQSSADCQNQRVGQKSAPTTTT